MIVLLLLSVRLSVCHIVRRGIISTKEDIQSRGFHQTAAQKF